MRNIIIIFLLLALQSCQSIYGLKLSDEKSENEIIAENSEHNITAHLLVDSGYVQKVESSNLNKYAQKDLLQPLQFWVFTKDTLTCNIVNCYTGGFPNLKWNLNEVYHARTIYSDIDSQSMGYIKNQLFALPQSDSVVVVVYSYRMGRQNKIFLRHVARFAQTHNGYAYYYINADKIY